MESDTRSKPSGLKPAKNLVGAKSMRLLEERNSVVEHLDGMNRFRAGLHVPGNVLIACATCNREKRRDDQLKCLVLADSGWESFLLHDGKRCKPGCKSCNYWNLILPDEAARHSQLEKARHRIQIFQATERIASLTEQARPLQSAALSLLPFFYTQGQEHAHNEIHRMCSEIEEAAR